MSNELSTTASSTFERIKRVNEQGGEFWSARELAKVLEYSDFRNFISVINKARQACTNSERPITDHFVDITEMVGIGSGAWRPIEDWALSRYACYLIIQNADPSKPLVALGQSYFAIQTRRQELADDEALKEDQRRLLLRKEMRKHTSSWPAPPKKRVWPARRIMRSSWIMDIEGFMAAWGCRKFTSANS
jgi:DNA-damage-inducible protein D